MNFNQLSYEVMENDGALLMITLSQASSVEFEVTIITMEVTAIG